MAPSIYLYTLLLLILQLAHVKCFLKSQKGKIELFTFLTSHSQMNTACKTFEPSCLSFDENCMKLAFEEAERALKEGEVPVRLYFNIIKIPIFRHTNPVTVL